MALVGKEENVVSGRWGSKAWVGEWHPEDSVGLEDNLGLLDKTVQIAVVNCYFSLDRSKDYISIPLLCLGG